MKTYLKVLFGADGARPSEVHTALTGLGFQAMHGAHDYAYDWPGSASVDEVLHFGDSVQAALEGMGCMFELETL